MNKIIPIIILLTLPISAQALEISGGGAAATSADRSGAEVHSDITVSTKGSDTEKEDRSTDSDQSVGTSANDDLDIESETTETSIVNAMKVESETELADFSDSIRSTNHSVESVDTESEDSVAIEYAHSAKLFGIIPIRINSTTVVKAATDGSPMVTTTFPWWKIFVSGVSKTSSTVDSSLMASESAKTYVSAKTSAHAKAVLTETIVATLNAEAGLPLLGQ